MNTLSPDTPPAERVRDMPAMLEAVRRAVREALKQHKRAGNPIAIWQDGQVVWLAPEDIPVDDEDGVDPRGA